MTTLVQRRATSVTDDALDFDATERSLDVAHLVIDLVMHLGQLTLGLPTRHDTARTVVDRAARIERALERIQDGSAIQHRARDQARVAGLLPPGADQVRVARRKCARGALTVNETFPGRAIRQHEC